MSQISTARLLVGRRITGFELQPFDDKRGSTAHDPIFTLDNGARIMFEVEETSTGEYGVRPVYFPGPKPARKKRLAAGALACPHCAEPIEEAVILAARNKRVAGRPRPGARGLIRNPKGNPKLNTYRSDLLGNVTVPGEE